MKKVPVLLCAATVLTVMSACSTPPANSSAPVTVAGETAAATPLPTATPSVSASEGPSATPPPAQTATSQGPPPATQTQKPSATSSTSAPSPVADPLKELNLNSRGNVPVEVGKTGTFGETGGGQEFAKLTVVSIDTNFKCTAPGALPSLNGQYIRLNLSLSASSNFADSGWPSLAMSAPDFSVWDSSAVRLSDPIGNSGGCVDQSAMLPSPIEPGTTEKGAIILDVAAGSGSASYVIGGFEGSYGWEWAW